MRKEEWLDAYRQLLAHENSGLGVWRLPKQLTLNQRVLGSSPKTWYMFALHE